MSTDLSIAFEGSWILFALYIEKLLMVEVLDRSQEVLQIDYRNLSLSFSISANLAPRISQENIFTLFQTSIDETKVQKHLSHSCTADFSSWIKCSSMLMINQFKLN